MDEMLKVNNLSVEYKEFTLHPISFTMKNGEILSIIGESGSGKTTIAKAISCLMDKKIPISGEVYLNGNELLAMKDEERRKLRMREFSIVLQNSIELLNPSMTLENQLKEILIKVYDKSEIKERMTHLMNRVGLCKDDLKRYPKELSGGMAQKFMIASAIALNPKLIIMDEPTSALDVASRDSFITLIRNLNKELNIGFLIITHDLKVSSELSDNIIVLYGGHIVERGKTKEVLENPYHPYTRGLINSSIGINIIKDIWGIRGNVVRGEHHGCPFYGRCTQSINLCEHNAPKLQLVDKDRYIACNRGGVIELLEGINISKAYGKNNILNGVNLKIYSGEVVSIVGKSGVGKSTLAMILGGFLKQYDNGQINFEGNAVDFSHEHKRIGGIQMVFQDSEAALNPHMTVRDAVSEPLKLAKFKDNIEEKVANALIDTGLPYDEIFLSKKIKSLSGGQKQRVNLARALTMDPKIMIADEPTSMLDPSSKANIIRMLKGLQNTRGFSMLMISHDLESVLKISDRTYLLKEGKLEKLNIEEYLQLNFNNIFNKIV